MAANTKVCTFEWPGLYKVVVVVASCKRVMVANINYKIQAQPSRMSRHIKAVGSSSGRGNGSGLGSSSGRAGERQRAGRGAAAGWRRSILYSLFSLLEVSFKE